jgi:hypothetical protein
MRIILLSIVFIFSLCATAETVYRSVDENGNIIFSDKPSDGAEKIHVEDAQTISPPSAGPFKYTPTKKEQPQGYTDIAITSPANDTATRNNEGNVTVSVTLNPGLNSGKGDQLALYMDGAQVSIGYLPQFELKNVDRGLHTLKASVIDASGKTIISSSPVSFTILRAHR